MSITGIVKMEYRECQVCGRAIVPGIFQVNFCRAFMALDFVALHPGLTTWELAKKTGVSYGEMMEGLNKARLHDWVFAVQEEREQGGIRYRYFPLEDTSVVNAAKALHAEQVNRQTGYLRERTFS